MPASGRWASVSTPSAVLLGLVLNAFLNWWVDLLRVMDFWKVPGIQN